MGTSLQPCLLSIGLLSILGFSVRFYSLFFKAVNVQPPAYITSIICSLRCTGKDLLHVPRSRLKQKGDKASAVTASWLWNQLLPDIKRASSISAFKSGLKSHFYSLAFSTHQPLFCCYMCKSKDLRVYLCSNSVLFSHEYSSF